MPSVRGAVRGNGDKNTPGLRNTSRGAKKNDRLGPAQGQVLSEGRVNGIHVRVSAPKAPRPDNSHGTIIDTKARERNLSADLPPEMMATQSTQMIAGQDMRPRPTRAQASRRPKVQQLPAESPKEAAPQKAEVINAEIVEAAPTGKPEMAPGTYWSDKHERYVVPGETEYSAETAQRMGVAV